MGEVPMSDWSEVVQTRIVPRLTPVPLEERSAILTGHRNVSDHIANFDRLDVLREIEAGGMALCPELSGPARILFWNVERLRHLDAIAATIQASGADVAILCEVDRGMARSGNTDRIGDLQARIGGATLYAVEFVELGLGDVREARQHAGEANRDGLHGAALIGRAAFTRPFLIRVDARGHWFDGAFEEPRVGGTIALGARVRIDAVEVTIVSVHLESHCDPALRGADMQRMLALIETVAAGEPVILGGDFNTSTAGLRERRDDRAAWLARLAQEPQRLSHPQPWEPLFGVAAAFGYDWHACNVEGVPTQRFLDDDPRPRAKLDWFFTRGLVARDPEIIPAVQANGSPSSDHDALLVTIRPSSPAS
jgi:endonuclease/exonuclease/phosphatase family metal-dependent hydrolase